jgi:hypothetical protein
MNALREPLLHFLAIGAVLFAAHAAIAPDEGGEAKPETAIRITAADVERLGRLWARQWRRAPTAEELGGLLADELKEEVLAREARRLKLDADDVVVRRRLAQKMAFLLEDTARLEQPSDVDLRALYEARPDISRAPARLSFMQIFFKGEGAEERARIQAASLPNAPAVVAETGDRFLLGNAFDDVDEPSVAHMFGPSFAHAVAAVEIGRWSGPFRSAYGFHLVKVTATTPSFARSFDEVRDRLVEEWRIEKQESAKAQVYAGLLRRHEIVADPEVRPLLRPLLNESEPAR